MPEYLKINPSSNESGSVLMNTVMVGSAITTVLMMTPSYFTVTTNKLHEKHTNVDLANRSTEVKMMLRTPASCLRILGPTLKLQGNEVTYSSPDDSILKLMKKSGSLVPTTQRELELGPLPADKITLGQPLFSGKKTYRATFELVMGTNGTTGMTTTNGAADKRAMVYSFPVYLVFDASNRLTQCQGTQVSRNDTLTTEDRICRLLVPAAGVNQTYNPETRTCGLIAG